MKENARSVYSEVFRRLRRDMGVYDAFDKRALERVGLFNYFCRITGEYEAVDAAFRSWEAVGIHRPTTKAQHGYKSRKQLHYRQLAINS